MKVWILTDKNGNDIIRGRKRDVMQVASARYLYESIYDDCLYRTTEDLN